MIDDVIAVHRAAACGQDRREVNVADAERGEIRNLCTGCVEAEVAMQLQPHRRANAGVAAIPTAVQVERPWRAAASAPGRRATASSRSEEHTSELQSRMRTSPAVFRLQK